MAAPVTLVMTVVSDVSTEEAAAVRLTDGTPVMGFARQTRLSAWVYTGELMLLPEQVEHVPRLVRQDPS